ncbi:MAG: DNA cytosine methyltransferase [Alphaproteobacteria bacterium]|nr:DNA cytosine methyltransferase [Alphaproteobacteria bacterium]
MAKRISIWDISVEVEANGYNWKDAPVVTKAKETNKQASLIHIDLFCGCGGFSVGFEAAGFTTEVALDIHPPSLKTLQGNHKHASTILGDICHVSSQTISELISNDKLPVVVTAGVPCQGFSLSNRKRHAGDKRNFLFQEFIRLAEDLEPDAVVLENVSGLVSTADGEFKREIAKAISQLGYDVYFSCLNAADYGVPQKRRRVFFVGVRPGVRWLFPKKTHGEGLKPYHTVGDAILGDLPSLLADEMSEEYETTAQTELQKKLRGKQKSLLNHQAPNHPQETIDKIAKTAPGQPMYPEFKQRIRLSPDQPSPTQICGGIRPQFQFGHPTQPRGLTIRERARLQSFPDSYFFSGGVVQGRVQTGNAVPPLLSQALAEQLAKVLAGEKICGDQGEFIQDDLFDQAAE